MSKRIRSAFRRIVYPKGSTALRWKEILILFLALMCTAMSITILFPFLPAMVKHFGKSEEETGYYAGLIASSMFLGRFLSSYFWGNLADKFGRRPIVIISLFLLGTSVFSFGLSTSVTVAMITRFGVGLSNGFLGTAKAIISELCDHTNQSLGMSALTSAYSTGLIFGPALGGFLSEVGRKYPRLFPKGSFFERFPFLLPCLINSVLLMLSMVMMYLWLPETLARKKRADSIKKEEDCEESKSFVFSSLLKKSDEQYALETCKKTNKETRESENERTDAETEIKENESVDYSSDKKCDKSSVETREMQPGNSGGEDVRSVKDGSSTEPKTCESLLDVHDKDVDTNGSRNSKVSDLDATCTESEANEPENGTCSVNEVDQRTRESECIERPNGECPREDDLHEDDNQTKEKQDKDESSETENTSQAHESCDKNETERGISSDRCNAFHKKDEQDAAASKPDKESTSRTTDPKKPSTVPRVDSDTKCCCSCCGSKKDSNLWKILKNCNAVLSVLVYSLFSFSVIGSDELFNIWGATDPRLSGLGFSTDDLGTAILVVGIAMILIQPTILPKLERRLGTLLNFQVCTMSCIFFVIIQPALRVFFNRPVCVSVLWPVLLIHLAMLRISVSGAFLSCFLLINNSVKSDLLCSINGLAVSVCSLFRAMAPSVGGSLFAWSISSGYKLGFPFNVNLAFIFFGFVYLLSICLSCFLSESLNQPKCLRQKLVRLSRDNLLEAKG